MLNESQFMSESIPDSGLTSKSMNTEEREYRKAQKLEKKEQDRIAARFKVMTADEFEKCFS